MNQPEILKSPEQLPATSQENHSPEGSLTKAEVEEVYAKRQSFLGKIRADISLKFYHQVSDKLNREKKQFEQLLNWEDNKQEVLSRYSFVLNPYYFEQKFFGTEE